ncbi:MAG: single-stranded-DNA-specific exonuclease RecJ, partial [Planctomycetes bacterium]|nr:single-stranded-DNA-specific exonuclease RecJ [Planctomycetota bacterium]
AIARSLAERRRICIFGDYDVDGLAATAMLVHVLRHAGGDVIAYVPDRLREGYGLNADALRQIAAQGVKLLITVDGGVNNPDEIALAQGLGLEVVITDHHPIHSPLPDCPVLHPARPDRPSPFPELCGAGVAYKLLWGLGTAIARGPRVTEEYRTYLLEALAFVALATIADVAPIVGENRVLVHHGLAALARTQHAGLRALLSACGFARAAATAEDVAFRVAPAINAAGRLGRAELALELLLCEEPGRAEVLAAQLVAANRERKTIEQGMLAACEEALAARGGAGPAGALVLAGEGWHSGVAGIVAARLVDRYRRPVFVLAIQNGIARGSARSIPELPLEPYFAVARACARSAGGHSVAGGLVVEAARVEELRAAIESVSGAGGALAAPALALDLALGIDAIDLAAALEVERLAPFGRGNEIPRLRIDGVTLAGAPRVIGRTEEHLQFHARATGRAVRGIFFGGASWARHIAGARRPFAVAGELTVNRHGSAPAAEIKVIDIRID